MNMTSITIESVHGIKQTVVLVPSSQSNIMTGKAAIQPTTGNSEDEDRPRSSK